MPYQRPLGTTEHLWLRMGQIDSNNFLMVAKVTGTLKEEAVNRALQEVIQAQGILRSRVVLKSIKPILKVEETLSKSIQVIERMSDLQWLEIAEGELKSTIEVDCFPLWRLKWLKSEDNHELILTFNHMVADGRSGANFFDSLFLKIENPDVKISNCPLPVAYEEQLCSGKQQGNYLLGWLSELRGFIKNSCKSWFKLKSEAQEGQGTGIVHQQIDFSILSGLLSKCRDQKTTVSQYLAAVMLDKLTGQSSGQHTGLSMAVDVRPYLENDHSKDIGYFVTTVDLAKDSTENSNVWELSRKFKAITQKKLNRSNFKFEQFIRKLALKSFNSSEEFKAIIRKTVNNSMMLTNIGCLNQKSVFSDFKVNACFHVPAVHLVGVPFLCLATSTLNGSMVLNLTYPKAHTSKDFAQDFLEDVIQALRYC
ncbi:MAG: condensation domain-containing protein [Lentisphaerales bacterium]|nr:condensation domain-containing protein [Lentisphaerales bacterium]